MKKNIGKRSAVFLTLTFLAPALGMAAGLEPSAAPTDAASAGYTTDDLYNRLQSGAAATKRTGGFTEPSAGPADNATKTLDEIMAVAPAPNNGTGLKPSEAPNGKVFWGLNQAAGSWGPQTGSNANVVDTSEATAPAAAATIATGKKAFVNGAAVTGTLPAPGPIYACTGTLNGTRWCDNGNGTVRDMTTGLVWLKNANCAATLNGVVKTSTLTWDNARIWSAAMVSGQCGLTDGSSAGDWRLPTKNELVGVTTGIEPLLSGNPRNFSGVQNSDYWSSSSFVGDSTAAVMVGNGGLDNSVPKTYDTFVWPVRGGQ